MDRKSWVILTLLILLVVSIIGSIFLGLLLTTKDNASDICDKFTVTNTASNVSQPSSIDKNDSSICYEMSCLLLAARLYQEIDQSIDPCDDFYQFACGGFIDSTTIPEVFSKSKELHEKIKKVIKRQLHNDVSIDGSKYLKPVRELYKTCNAYELDDTTSTVPNGFKTWPIINDTEWVEDSFDINTIIFTIDERTYRQNYLFEFDFIDTEIIVGPYPYESFTVESLIEGVDNDQIKSYYSKMTSEIEKMHGGMNYDDELNEILNFEIELNRKRLSEEQKFDPNFDTVVMTLDKLTNNFSFFNWQEHINYLRGSPVNLSTTVTINNFSYLKKLQNSFNSTETKRIVANYVIWKHIEDYTMNAFLIKTKGCINFVISKLPIAAGAIYIQSHNYTKIKSDQDNIHKMILNIQEKFLEVIQNADWIDDETRAKSINKLKLFKNTIPFLNYLTNVSKIDEYYKNLELSENENIYRSIERIKLFDQKKRMTSGDDYELANLGMQFESESVYYDNAGNSINIPYMILQSDFFDSEKPNYMNYGALGFFIGHEITHGYDFGGINFDGKSNWSLSHWTQFSKNNLHNKSQCIIKQYSSYTVREYNGFEEGPLIPLNGTISQRETVADNGGIKVAYQAYEKLSNTDKKLPGLDYTPKQLFWISYANSWCYRNKKEYLSLFVNDEHPLPQFRIIGSLTNSLEFAKDFNCPSESNMNPTEKCSVW